MELKKKIHGKLFNGIKKSKPHIAVNQCSTCDLRRPVTIIQGLYVSSKKGIHFYKQVMIL